MKDTSLDEQIKELNQAWYEFIIKIGTELRLDKAIECINKLLHTK